MSQSRPRPVLTPRGKAVVELLTISAWSWVLIAALLACYLIGDAR